MKIKDFFRVLFTPSCWIQFDTYSKDWDILLNELMQKHDFVPMNEHTACINGIKVWISNHPYGSFEVLGVRPSRITILKAHDKLIKDLFQGIINNNTDNNDTSNTDSNF
jgi:hypothetical protein